MKVKTTLPPPRRHGPPFRQVAEVVEHEHLYILQYRNHRMYDSVDIAITFPGSNLAHDRPQ